MAEYDAFGRKTGENPLEQQPAPAEPVAAPAPATPAPRATKAFPVALAAAVVVVIASIGLAISFLAGSSEDGAGGPVTVEGGPVTVEEAPPAAPGEPPAPDPVVDRGSLFDRPLLARAVKALRVAELGRPISLRVAAERIDAQLITSKGLLRTVQIGLDGEPRELNATQAGPVPSMPWSAVDPAAPHRLIRAATEREKRSAADVDYLVLIGLDKPTWGLFFKGGTHYQGNAAGKLTRRVSP